MIVFNTDTRTLIYPYEEQVGLWMKRWGISRQQLNEAILDTGSINIRRIRRYLVRKGILFSVFTIPAYLKFHLRKRNR